MAKREARTKACCLISELLEETGIDREHARLLRRQVLEGVALFCRWQLDRMQEEEPVKPRRQRKAKRVPVE